MAPRASVIDDCFRTLDSFEVVVARVSSEVTPSCCSVCKVVPGILIPVCEQRSETTNNENKSK